MKKIKLSLTELNFYRKYGSILKICPKCHQHAYVKIGKIRSSNGGQTAHLSNRCTACKIQWDDVCKFDGIDPDSIYEYGSKNEK